MLRFVVLACVLAAALASREDDCCSHDDRMAVLETWNTVWSSEYAHRRIIIAKAVFMNLLEHMPEAASLLSGVNSADTDSDEFEAHCVRVLVSLDQLINQAYDTDILHQELEHLGEQHARYAGVTAAHFEAFRKSLEEVLPQAIPCFDTEAFERCISIDHHYIEKMLPA